MATRAERFKSTTARHAQQDAQVSAAKGKNGKSEGGKTKGQQRTPSSAKRLARAAAPDERRYGGPSTAARNQSLGKKAIYALEDSKAPAKPSRKSTRRGKNRVKAATPLTGRQKLKVTSPTQQHDRGR